ncbi:hypothetical protein [Kribbella hippodromi]
MSVLLGVMMQQRHRRAGRGRGEVAQQLGELERFLDPDTGMAHCLDDCSGSEPACFGCGQTDRLAWLAAGKMRCRIDEPQARSRLGWSRSK